MNKYKLSIVIPAAKEEFLARTIQDALENTSEQTEIIATLDGSWADPPVPVNDRVSLIYVNKSVGMRAATNLAVKLSQARYIAKVDAHVSFDKDWDLKMLKAFEVTGDNVTMTSTMRNLWAFEWACYHNYCGWTKYQGPVPEKCEKCGKSDKIRRRMKWIGKERPQSNSYCFDAEPHFNYFNEYTKRPEYREALKKTGITETLSLQGSCFMCTREKYWELKLSDEGLGNWGNQGIELACKTWLSGGRVLVNHSTWYSHLFRTQGKGFGFPWEVSGKDCQRTKNNVKDLFWKTGFPGQKYKVSWLIEKFLPVPGWSDETLAQLRETEPPLPNL
jgi:glycosyltransferase involved in cell wall biosynthesis